jgi:DNA adenine methylase
MANPIIHWIGGNRRLADHLIPRFPKHECYVKVFAGGAALYFLRPPAAVEVINDINGELINLCRVVKHHLDEFVRQFKWAFTRQVFSWLQDTRPETPTDIQRADRFYYLQQNCFGAKLEGQSFGTATTTTPRYTTQPVVRELADAVLREASAMTGVVTWRRWSIWAGGRIGGCSRRNAPGPNLDVREWVQPPAVKC